jgi:integrase
VAKRPLRAADLLEILAQLDDGTAQGLRDRALLVVGFTGALRRSELVALDVEDIRWTREGMVLNIRVSKTDQEGRGIEVGTVGRCVVSEASLRHHQHSLFAPEPINA